MGGVSWKEKARKVFYGHKARGQVLAAPDLWAKLSAQLQQECTVAEVEAWIERQDVPPGYKSRAHYMTAQRQQDGAARKGKKQDAELSARWRRARTIGIGGASGQ